MRRRHGARAALRRAWAAVKVKLFGARRIVLFALTDPLAPPRAVAAAKGHEFRFATRDDLARLHQRGDADIAAHHVDALARGDRCLLQMDGDKLVGYLWVHASRLAFLTDGLHFNLPDDTAYASKSFTAPEYRGNAFQALRAVRMFEKLRSEGMRRMFAYVERTNDSSLKGIRKSGYREVGEIRLVKGRRRVRAVIDLESGFWCDVRRM